MVLVNENYAKLANNYLFAEVAKRIAAKKAEGRTDIISLGIGDVTLPLANAVTVAMHKAVDDMAQAETFQGYGPYEGFDFLREAICKNEYAARSVTISPDEIFVSDGAKSDMTQILSLFATGRNRIGITDPVYPVYYDSNVLAGNGAEIVVLPCDAENNFLPQLPSEDSLPLDIIYLCFPNNPTGVMIDKEQLTQWVDYAQKHKAIILYDAAYEAFISDDSLPHSIYEIEGAKEVALEFRSYSKKAGFTGTRLGYCVIPKTLNAYATEHTPVALNPLWMRNQATSYNGAPYVIQRGAEAIYTAEGKAETKAQVAYYLENANKMRAALKSLGYDVYGGQHAPYVWFNTGMDSWEFFDLLLDRCGVAGTPGVGFGECGNGFFRLTGFNSHENTDEAIDRIRTKLHS